MELSVDTLLGGNLVYYQYHSHYADVLLIVLFTIFFRLSASLRLYLPAALGTPSSHLFLELTR